MYNAHTINHGIYYTYLTHFFELLQQVGAHIGDGHVNMVHHKQRLLHSVVWQVCQSVCQIQQETQRVFLKENKAVQ